MFSLHECDTKSRKIFSVFAFVVYKCDCFLITMCGIQEAEYGPYKPENEYDYNNNLHWSQDDYMDGEDGELTWFNAGVRVGVGLGLGICLGVGIGVGLLVRTYQSTTRNFRRRLL